MDPELRINKQRMRAAFNQAATTYDEHAALQRAAVDHLLDGLDVIKLQPQRIADLGAGTGYCAAGLSRRFPKAQILLIDLSENMLVNARSKTSRWRSKQRFICADIDALPLDDASVDLVFSSLSFQWSNDLDIVFSECARILKPNGLLIFSSLGPDTLRELRAAWQSVDASPRVNLFIDMHDVGDALIRNGFASPVLECDRLTLTYDDAFAVMRDLKGIGAVNSLEGRRRGLLTKHDMKRMADAYEAFRTNGRLPATYELVYAHAWRAQSGDRPQDGSTVATFPFAELKRR